LLTQKIIIISLDLHSNQIERIEGLAALPNLKKLYLDDNHIYRIEGLSACTQLEELLLNNQTNNAGVDMSFEVESLEAISSTLRVLQLTHSNVIGVAPLTMLTNLEVVYLSRNPIFSFEDMSMMLQACPHLRDLRVSHTPLSEMPKYRESMIVAAEQLGTSSTVYIAIDYEEANVDSCVFGFAVMLDQREVTDRERTFLKTLHARKQSKPAEQ
jgi:Leucine-rich repeat (LRR) protein